MALTVAFLLEWFLFQLYFGSVVMNHGFEPSYGDCQTFEIRHNYLSYGFTSDGA
jgi:hypothetical protein